MSASPARIREHVRANGPQPAAPYEPGLPPGPRLPATLQTLAFVLAPMPFLKRCRRRHGNLFTLELAPRGLLVDRGESTWVMLADPELVEEVFTGDPDVLRAGEANSANQVMRQPIGSRSILVLDEPEHMIQRKLLLPPFHGERVQSYAALMSDVARSEVERWPVGEPFALWPRMQAITLEVIVRTVFGISELERIDRMRNLLSAMLNRGTSAGRLAMLVMLGQRRVARLSRSVTTPVRDALMEEIHRRRAATDIGERHDILSMLMQARYEDGSRLSDEELRDELMTLLIAGHESTATALAWAFERLVRHPDKLARLRDEAEAGEDEYADAVVKETLRLRPVIPFVLRRLTEPLEIGGHRLPAGVSVAPCTSLIHSRPDIYPEPSAFRPERFLERRPGAYTWFPFGGGVRRCVGASFAQLEMRQVLQTVAVHTELLPARAPSERLRRRFITLAPSRGAQVIMARRSSPAPPRLARRLEPSSERS
jgi:cytochrome P450 family 135